MKYKITVRDRSLEALTSEKKDYTGVFVQEEGMHGVELEALEYYAEELGTDMESLEIISTIRI